MAEMHTLLGYQDDADALAVAQGRVSAADATARLRGYGDYLYRNEFGAADLAAQRQQVEATAGAFLAAVDQAVAAARWPATGDAAGWQRRAVEQLAVVRQDLSGWLQRGLDPAPLLEQAVKVAGWTRGELKPARFFADHEARVLGALPTQGLRDSLAAATLPPAVDPSRQPPPPGPRGGAPPPAPPPLPPPAAGDFWDTLKAGAQPPPNGNPPAAHAEPPPTRTADPPDDEGLEVNVDRPGMDLAHFDLEAPDPTLCLTLCQDYRGCRSFTYVKPGVQGPSARCYIKSGLPPPRRDKCCVSGTP